MSVDPRTPVVAGAAAVSQRGGAADPGVEAVDLMAAAVEAAAGAQGQRLVADADWVLVPNGSWSYQNAARLVARRVGARKARTLVAELGVLQTTLVSWAAEAVASGRAEVVVVCGGEARWRDLVGAGPGGPTPAVTAGDGVAPDVRLAPAHAIVSPVEVAAGLINAPSHYALLENACRAAEGSSRADHLRAVADLWDRFNAVAVENPDAWTRDRWTSDQLQAEAGGNRMIAFPYRKWQVSQWNVDQAAALLICSRQAARSHHVPADDLVYVHSVAESNHMVPVSERAELHRSPGFARAGRAALGAAGINPHDLDHVDLYSCFPVAVEIQMKELGIDPGRTPTVTGGMTWAGGPLNNYMLQSAVAMYGLLRARPGDTGLSSAVSGMVTKQGVMIWSASPPADGCVLSDVTAEVAEVTSTVPVRADAAGKGRVVSYTVMHDRTGPERAVVLADRADEPGRVLAVSRDAALMHSMGGEEWLGAAVEMDGSGGFHAM